VRRNLPFLIIAAVLLVAVGAGVLLYRSRLEPEPAPPPAPTATPSPLPPPTTPTAPPSAETGPSPTPAATETESASPTAPSTAGPTFNYGRPGAEPLHIRGEANAPVVLEEFGDFECLPCSKVFAILEALERESEKRLVVVFREHPLKIHHYALDAARAAEAAGLQGKFWEMHDSLYRNRATWVTAAYVRPYLNDYARDLQLDVDRFKEDIDGPAVATRILADQERGDSLGVDRTPIIYVNGEKVIPTDLNENGIRAMIEKALAAKSR
jgi:predicted DsbA family dithiol-disulfide isomerase